MKSMVNIVDKTKEGKLAANLYADEFHCKCSYPDCTFTLIDNKLKRQWNRFRSSFSRGIVISSGYRCQKHNEDVGGHPNSYHKKGMALDLIVPQHVTMKIFANTARNYFDKVIEYPGKNFIHVNVE